MYREAVVAEEKRILSELERVAPRYLEEEPDKYSLNRARIVDLNDPKVGQLDFPIWFPDIDVSFGIRARYDLFGHETWSCQVRYLPLMSTGDRPFTCHMNIQVSLSAYVKDVMEKYGIDGLEDGCPGLEFERYYTIEDFDGQGLIFPVLLK